MNIIAVITLTGRRDAESDKLITDTLKNEFKNLLGRRGRAACRCNLLFRESTRAGKVNGNGKLVGSI